MTTLDKAAPMPAAPMRYTDDGQVDWGNMWDSFCGLALDGGPPHRGILLSAPPVADSADPVYLAVVQEIIRGICEVSGLPAEPAESGWVAVYCATPGMARWLCEAVQAENVAARCADERLLVPAHERFTLKGEVKSVITAVAKTTHYWREHLPQAAKDAVEAQARFARLWRGIRGRFAGR
jgi:sirohydrochlorin cobaltochelatase